MPFTGSSSVLIAYVANNASNNLLIAPSNDGINWTGSTLASIFRESRGEESGGRVRAGLEG